MRIVIDRIPVDQVTMDQAVEQIAEALPVRSGGFHVVTPNAQFVQLARSDERFADIVRASDLSVADGVPLVWASRLLGNPLPGRVNGTDLMVRLAKEAALRGWTVYFLGGRPGAGEGAAKILGQQFPGLKVAGIDCPPMGFMSNPAQDAAASDKIRQAAPDILFVALGAPRQEYWAAAHRDLPAGAMVGVGGSFELVAGMTRRAPVLFQKYGLEWLWRLLMEPRRLLKRYLLGNTLFIFLVLRQWLTKTLFSRSALAPVTAVREDSE